MQIQINTDHNISGQDALTTNISNTVEDALSRFSDHITRIEVHLSDANSARKGGNDDMRCLIEARLKGQQPIAVTEHAATVGVAVGNATGKLSRLIENTLGRLRDKNNRAKQPISKEAGLPD
jgi:ribosome-associated translation inhibitor RaiA